jgi:hypothetical protein
MADVYLNGFFWFATGAGSFLLAWFVIGFNATSNLLGAGVHALTRITAGHCYELYDRKEGWLMQGWHSGIKVGDLVFLTDHATVKAVRIMHIEYALWSESGVFTAKVVPASFKKNAKKLNTLVAA